MTSDLPNFLVTFLMLTSAIETPGFRPLTF
jgi:hypothetical protein